MAVFTPGISPYSYANDNPINYIDYYGLGILDWFKKKKNPYPFYKPYQRPKQRKPKQRHNRRSSNRSNNHSNTSSATASTPVNRLPYLDPLASMSVFVPNDFDSDLAPVSPFTSGRPDVPGSDIPIPRAGYSTNFSGEVRFNVDSDRFYSIEATDKVLSALVNTLQDAPALKVLILGNAGSDGIERGTIYGNTSQALEQTAIINGRRGTVGQLMTSRARAVYNYLIDRGISPERLLYGPGNYYNNIAGRKTTFVISNP